MILVNIIKSLYDNIIEMMQITSGNHIRFMFCGNVVKNVS